MVLQAIVSGLSPGSSADCLGGVMVAYQLVKLRGSRFDSGSGRNGTKVFPVAR